jgi:hypothetical protein
MRLDAIPHQTQPPRLSPVVQEPKTSVEPPCDHNPSHSSGQHPHRIVKHRLHRVDGPSCRKLGRQLPLPALSPADVPAGPRTPLGGYASALKRHPDPRPLRPPVLGCLGLQMSHIVRSLCLLQPSQELPFDRPSMSLSLTFRLTISRAISTVLRASNTALNCCSRALNAARLALIYGLGAKSAIVP